MSYISNGCNDCSSVDFGNNMMGGNMMGGNMMGGGGNMFETTNNGNQFTFQPQQQQQMPQQMPQQMQQAPMPQPPKQQMLAPQVPVKMPQQQMVVAKPQQQVQLQQPQSNTVTGIIGNYFYDNAFTITIAFLVASAWHTTIKYYIDHAIKFSGGTPVYYVGYAVLVTVAAIFLTTLKH
jgi:hypothetical protein